MAWYYKVHNGHKSWSSLNTPPKGNLWILDPTGLGPTAPIDQQRAAWHQAASDFGSQLILEVTQYNDTRKLSVNNRLAMATSFGPFAHLLISGDILSVQKLIKSIKVDNIVVTKPLIKLLTTAINGWLAANPKP